MLKKLVTDTLHALGMPAHIKGYAYTRDAIIMTIEDMSVINAITKVLYPRVAKMHNTTNSRVERAIRHAIELVWSRGSYDMLNKFFGYTIDINKGKPTNSEFIALIADRFITSNAAALNATPGQIDNTGCAPTYRPCTVKGRKAYFHVWHTGAELGSLPAALVEFTDGTLGMAMLQDIVFTDAPTVSK